MLMYPVVALILTSIWMAWTVLVDFFVVPAVFQNIAQFFEAGNLGLVLFGRLNTLEFPLSCLLLICVLFSARRFPALKWLVLCSLTLVGISSLYMFSLTPKLSQLTATWEYAEKMGTLGTGGEDVQQLHQTYHSLYVGLDTVKLILLLAQGTILGVFLSRASR